MIKARRSEPGTSREPFGIVQLAVNTFTTGVRSGLDPTVYAYLLILSIPTVDIFTVLLASLALTIRNRYI